MAEVGIIGFMSAMLASLRIRNLALVEEVDWELGPGLTVVTGETGAGKSVIVGALNLLVGERADRSMVRSGAEQCTVEGVFENFDDGRLAEALEEAGVERCEEGRLLIKRVVLANGGGRQFVNGSPCTVALLRRLGSVLVDLHGPHDHQSLFSREQQTRLLDRFAGSEGLRVAFEEARRRLTQLEKEREALEEGERSAEREMDLLRHQVAEIQGAVLKPGEEDVLVAKHQQAVNAARVGEILGRLKGLVSGEGFSVEDAVGECVRASRELEKLDPGAVEVARAAEALWAAVGEFSLQLGRHAKEFEESDCGLAELEARLDLIQFLKRKYGRTVEEVMEFGRRAAERLGNLERRAERCGMLDEEIERAREAMMSAARELSERRKPAAKILEERISAGLLELGFANCEFRVRLEEVGWISPMGAELVDFEFAPNPGEPLLPLRSIASSGEISRMMLVLKGALAAQDDVPLLVFDEIDANVGGEVATKVGRRMRELGKGRQVVCITHLPQVAAAGENHFVVAKVVEDGRTRATISPCRGVAREEELARMLGGRSQQSALVHARELLAVGAS